MGRVAPWGTPVPESLWSRDDEVWVGRVTVAARHLHGAGAVPVNRCLEKEICRVRGAAGADSQ